MVPAGILLVICLAALARFVRDDIADYAAFKTLEGTRDRQRRYRVWILKSFLGFFGGSVLALAALGRLGALTTAPPEFAPALRAIHGLLPGFGAEGAGFGGGVIIGAVVAMAVGVFFGRRIAGQGEKRRGVIGDIEPLMPRNAAETAHAAVLSLNAGVSEEVFFRLLLPLLLALVLGAPMVAFGAAAIIFGLVHVYQGWIGVVATTVLGLVLTAIYLATGSLLAAIATHALIDIFGLVVRPTFFRLARSAVKRS